MKRKIAAILAADIVGYSRLVAEDEEDTLTRLDSYRRVYEDFVVKAGGRIFNTAGDSVLAEFSSAVEATRCAIDIQESIRTRNLGYPASRQMLFRMGLTIGDVVEREGDLLGDGVNIAARLEGLAAPGGICVSQSVFEQVANKISVPFRDIGQQEVKNIPQPIHAFMVEMRGEGVRPEGLRQAGSRNRVSAMDRQGGQNRNSGAALFLGLIVSLAGLGALGVVYWRQAEFNAFDPGTGKNIASAPVETAKVDVAANPDPNAVKIRPGDVPETSSPIEKTPVQLKKSNNALPELSTPGRIKLGQVKPPKVKLPQQTVPQKKPDGPVQQATAISKPDDAPKPTDPAKQADGPENGADNKVANRSGNQGAPQTKISTNLSTAQPANKQATAKTQPAPVAGPPAQSPVNNKPAANTKPVATAKLTIAPKPPQAVVPAKPKYPPGANPAQVFALLSKAGGIVQDAKTPPELYHNARVFEARGQAAAARRAYAALVKQNIETIDVHIRFAALLRAQDGRAGAREVYGELINGKGGPVAALLHAMQFSGASRRAKVAAFAARHPAYAPAQIILAREYSADRIGRQTLKDKRSQFAALGNFLKAEDGGGLPKYFMDHSVLTAWVDEARRIHGQLEKYFKTAVLKPVASYMRSNQGWMVNLSLPEVARAISYKIAGADRFRPTGSFPHIDQRTGRPMANPSFELPKNAKAMILQVRYRDANNVEQGPFDLKFDPLQALVSGQRNILERFSNSWLVFGKDIRRSLLYFTHLVSYRCAISKAMVGYDDGPLDKRLPIPACDMQDPHAIPRGGKIYLRIADGVRKVRIQLTYADGSRSEEKTFARP